MGTGGAGWGVCGRGTGDTITRDWGAGFLIVGSTDSLPLLICEWFTPPLTHLPLHCPSGQPQKVSRPLKVSLESGWNTLICPDGKLFHVPFVSNDTAVSEVPLSPGNSKGLPCVLSFCFLWLSWDPNLVDTRSYSKFHMPLAYEGSRLFSTILLCHSPCSFFRGPPHFRLNVR